MADVSFPQAKDEVLTFSIKVVGCTVMENTLTVTSKTTLRDLKLMLIPYKKETSKYDLLFLVRGEQMVVALDRDRYDLDHYGVEEGDKIWLYAPFHIVKLLVPSMGLSDEFKIRKSHSFLDIKKLIEEKWGVPVRNLCLYFNGLKMDDSKCVDDYRFIDYSEIYAVVRKDDARNEVVLTVSMSTLGERKICVEECFTGMDIKTVIESDSHWPPASYLSLSFGDHSNVRKLYDWDTVLNFGLEDMMKLSASHPVLLPSMQLHILHGGRNIATVSATPLDTVTKLMNVIHEKVLPGHEPALNRGDTKLELKKYLARYNLKNESRVNLEWAIRLAVTLPGGRVRGVIIKHEYTVDETGSMTSA